MAIVDNRVRKEKSTGHKVFTFNQSSNIEGIITELNSESVSWAAGTNIHFNSGRSVSKIKGQSLLATVTNTSPIRALFTFVGMDGIVRTIACTDTKIYSFTNDFATETDITGAVAPTSDATDVWQFSLVGGMPIISNGKEAPWKWAVSGNGDYAASLTTLGGTPPSNAKAMTVSQNRLILGNLIDGSTRYPARIRWSDIAEPEVWTIIKEGLPSDRQDFIDSDGGGFDSQEIIRSMSSTNNFLHVFTDRNVYIGTPSEHPWTWTFKKVVDGIGLLAPRAITKGGNITYFMGLDDFYMMSPGSAPVPISGQIRSEVFSIINNAALNTSFAHYELKGKEIYFAVPTGSSATPNKAYIYNIEYKNWAIQDIDFNARSIGFTDNALTWDGLSSFADWDSMTGETWNGLSARGLIPFDIVGNNSGQILKFEDTNNLNGAGFLGSVETGDYSLGSTLHDKAIHEVWPHMVSQDGQNAVMVQVGTRQSLADDISWTLPEPLTIGVDRKVTFRKSGKFVRLRFFSDAVDSPWEISGYDIVYSMRGSR